jgi:hypothetical protein
MNVPLDHLREARHASDGLCLVHPFRESTKRNHPRFDVSTRERFPSARRERANVLDQGTECVRRVARPEGGHGAASLCDHRDQCFVREGDHGRRGEARRRDPACARSEPVRAMARGALHLEERGRRACPPLTVVVSRRWSSLRTRRAGAARRLRVIRRAPAAPRLSVVGARGEEEDEGEETHGQVITARPAPMASGATRLTADEGSCRRCRARGRRGSRKKWPSALPPERPDDGVCERAVVAALAHDVAEAGRATRREARTHVASRRHANAIASAAELVRERRDEADAPARAVARLEVRRRAVRGFAIGLRGREARAPSRAMTSLAGTRMSAGQLRALAERHQLDETRRHTPIENA